jgi:hypothetical protein
MSLLSEVPREVDEYTMCPQLFLAERMAEHEGLARLAHRLMKHAEE